MKKIVLFLIICMSTSCADVTQMRYGSLYQKQTLTKFKKKKHYAKGGDRYVPHRKKGSYNHPAVTRDTYKYLRQF